MIVGYLGMTGLESSAMFATTNPNLYVKYEEVFNTSVSKCKRRRIYADSENCKVELVGNQHRLDFIFSGKSF